MFLSKKSAEPEAAAPLFTADESGARRARAWLDSRLARAKKDGCFNEVVKITPALAELLLSLNIGNRPLRHGRVADHARAMKAGAWRLTHQGMAINIDGVLQDGQHRLSAVVESGCVIESKVFFGEPVENFDVLDTNMRTRGNADVLALSGEKHYALLASSITLLNAIERKHIRGVNHDDTLRNDELDDFLRRHPGIRKACNPAQEAAHALKIAPTPIAVAYYLISRKYGDKAALFCEQLKSGLGLTNARDPIYVLRKDALRNYTYGNTKGRPRQAFAASMIIAFNRWNAGEKTTTVAWRDGADFPKVA